MTVREYIVTGLTTGLTYSFKVQAKNSEGYSTFSNTVSILAAQTPDAPSSPTTSIVNDQLTISWAQVNSNGQTISAYRIEIQDHSGNYHTQLTYCDGSVTAIVTSRSCTMPLSVLYVAPFNMVLGDHIYAKIIAINGFGDSLASTPGDGAAVVFLPDAPINLANNAPLTTDKTVGLTWQNGLSNGGKPILDYRVWYDQGTNQFIAL